MQKSKTKVIEGWKTPTTITELCGFLGMINYYHKFIPNMALIAGPLNELLKKDVDWRWKEPEISAFETLKKAITTAPILRIPDTTQAFTIHVDASNTAIGAVLSQEEHPTGFMSRRLTDAERNYSAYDREALAVVTALRHWRHLILNGQPIRVECDNRSVKHLLTQKDLSPRQARWADLLSEYPVEIVHIRGKDNLVADALSRSLNTTETQFEMPEEIKKAIVDGWKKFDVKLLEEDSRCNITEEGIVYFDGRLYVPEDNELKTRILVSVHHDGAGHLGREKTLDLVKRHFYWPGLTLDVEEFVRSCDICQRTKKITQAPAGLLHPIPPPDRPWEEINMDFMSMEETPRGLDSIAVVIDRLSKMGHFIRTRKDVTAKKFAQQFLDVIVRFHGLPKKIISDRDTKFTSEFWREVFNQLKVKIAMTTASHPEADGQAENRVKTVRTMLRSFAAEYRQDWDLHLPILEMQYNNTKNATTGLTPFETVFGYNITTPLDILSGTTTLSGGEATSFIKQLHRNVKVAKKAIEEQQQQQKLQADKHRREQVFDVGDMVLLSTKDLRNYYKQDPTFIGPYKVIEKRSDLTYKLELPAGMKLHPVFHTSKLRKYETTPDRFKTRKDVPPPPVLIDGYEEFVVEKILDRRIRNRGKKQIVEYLVKWLGYPMYQATWEPYEHVADTKAMDDYEVGEESVTGP